MRITKKQLKRIIKEEVARATDSYTAEVDYNEGGIRSDLGNFISFEEIEGPEDMPHSEEEIRSTLFNFFKENGVAGIRDIEMDTVPIPIDEWVSTMIMNHPAGLDSRPPDHAAGGYSVRDLRAQGIDPSDTDAF